MRALVATVYVMPALVAGIHAFLAAPPYPSCTRGSVGGADVDGRDKPGHDSE